MDDLSPRRAPLLEICVDTIAGLEAAIDGGADRIELCSALALGGLTPTPGLIAAAAGSPVPVRAMIRPRAGSFRFDTKEADAMRREIDAVGEAGLSGVVLGAATAAGALDLDLLGELAERAGGMALTLHRVVDLLPDPGAAVEQAIALGFATILSSGGAVRADEGVEVLGTMASQARGRIEILAGSGVAPGNVARIVAAGITAVHASCGVATEPDKLLVRFGFEPSDLRATSAAAVVALRRALRAAVAAAGAGG